MAQKGRINWADTDSENEFEPGPKSEPELEPKTMTKPKSEPEPKSEPDKKVSTAGINPAETLAGKKCRNKSCLYFSHENPDMKGYCCRCCYMHWRNSDGSQCHGNQCTKTLYHAPRQNKAHYV